MRRISKLADILARHGVYLPNDAKLTEAIKTQSGYRNAMWRAVVAFYNEKIDEFEFVGRMADLISDQMRRAYNEGLRSTGIDPKDMTADMQKELAAIIASEDDFVLGFAQDIIDNREKDPRPPSTIFSSRVDTWSNRYPDVVSRGALAGGKKEELNLEWIIGVADHCETCVSLNGTVATADQWAQSGYQPQNPPNAKLDCGGWECKCSLETTDKDATIPADGTITV